MRSKFQKGLVALVERKYSGVREVVGLLDAVRKNVESHAFLDTSDAKTEADGGRGARLIQTSILIGQEVQPSSSCPIKKSCQTNNNALIG